MDFRAINVVSQAVYSLMEEIPWCSYGEQLLHVPVIATEKDCYHLDMLMDMMGTLTRMMDTRMTYVTTDGKVIREWIEAILEIGDRYRRELELLKRLDTRMDPEGQVANSEDTK